MLGDQHDIKLTTAGHIVTTLTDADDADDTEHQDRSYLRFSALKAINNSQPTTNTAKNTLCHFTGAFNGKRRKQK